MKQINLNSTVSLVLTRKGAQIFSDRTSNPVLPGSTVDLLLWEVLEIFGSDARNGASLFVNNVLCIDEAHIDDKTMTLEEFNSLKHGIYRIHWLSGGISVAAIGVDSHGNRWIAPTNWVAPSYGPSVYKEIKEVELITTQEQEEQNNFASFFEK